MKISFYGGTREVTGSSHIIEANGKKILLDCGLHQGRRKESRIKNKELLFDAKTVDAVVLGHAHIDHSGNLPSLHINGFNGPIYSTKATDDLCHYMLADSGYLQERDAAIINRKHEKKGLPQVFPLYTVSDAMDTVRLFNPKKYYTPFQAEDGIEVTFVEAGHILGAALTVVEVKEGDRKIRIGYVVDLGRKNLPLLRDPDILEDLDYMILESTYGNRMHENIELAKDQLREMIITTHKRGGKLIIPSFAVERTQEIIYHLHHLTYAKEIPDMPIYVDSPLAVNVTSAFKKNMDILDKDFQKVFREQEDPFGFDKLRYVRATEDSKALNMRTDSHIIVSASGMCEGGRILHHLEHNIGNKKNTILFVGFMAQHTLGRRIMDGAESVRIFGDMHRVNAEIRKAGSFSAHADKEELLDYVKHASKSGRLKKIFLVHGEETASLELALSIKDQGFKDVYVPHPTDFFDL